MPRQITSHKINGLNDGIEVLAHDEVGPGGASQLYSMSVTGTKQKLTGGFYFQTGPIQENGINGISNESLIAIVIDRLQGFQSGPFACRENALALTKLEEAMHWLHHRTRERLARGVEGTSEK